ncbi:MAG: hypothetical protein M8467_18270 [Anaerolineae bacterium]|nr:hypothetical protein [Anaerolineae bacterium]
MSRRTFIGGQAPRPASEVQIESVGLNPLDLRRVDVAVDLTPFLGTVNVEMVIVGPTDDELCSITLVHNRDPMLDKIMHLRQDAQPGEHTLHIGIFVDEELVARAARTFAFPGAGPA